MTTETEPTANVGVIGTGVMGASLARNLARQAGNRVAIFNRDAGRMNEVADAHPEAAFVRTYSYQELAAKLTAPRTAIIMVPAGGATEQVIDSLLEVFQPGDIIIDAGNSLYTDTIRREANIEATGIHFVGVGVSGGEEGALWGPSIMPGGTEESYRTLGPIFRSIAALAGDPEEPCVTHIGTGGAGHFVKMVHNGIEYADMQLIAEAYDLIRRGTGKSPAQIAEVFAQWNQGELNSYLIEITAEVLRQVDADTGIPLVDLIVDQAGAKGTGAWTVQAAADLGVSVSGIAEALFARSLSSSTVQREIGASLPGPQGGDGDGSEGFIEEIRLALFASKIVAYSQGFDLIRAGAERFGWKIDLAAVARIWRGGCIIRAQFLDRISAAYMADAESPLLLAQPYFVLALAQAQSAWRNVVTYAAGTGVPAPVFASSLSYYDGLREGRLPAALLQGQRDFFGAHTYRRTDREGVFHTLWAKEGRPEVRTD